MRFTELRALTKVISSSIPDNNLNHPHSSNIYCRFYTLLLDEKKSEEIVIKELYPEKNKRNQYRMLKKRYWDKICSKLLIVEFSILNNSSIKKRIRTQLSKIYTISIILIESGQRSLAIKLLENNINTALKHGDSEFSFLMLNELRNHYSLFSSSSKLYKFYSKKFEEIKVTWNTHLTIEDIFIRLNYIIINSKNYSIHSQEILDIESKLKKNENHQIIESSYQINSNLLGSYYLIHLIKKDLKSQLKICNKAILYFTKHLNFSAHGLFTFTQNKGVTLIGLKRYDEALNCFKYCLELVPIKRMISWHNSQNYIFNIHVINEDYISAFKLISDITTNKSFKTLIETSREPWYPKEAFVHFLIKTGKINPENYPQYKLRPFRLNRFLNEVPRHSKDKKGLNITVLVIQMLFLLVYQKHDKVIDKLDTLRQYQYKYLQGDDFVRSSNFIKMLIAIPECNYEKKDIEKKVIKNLQLLKDNPHDYSEKSLSIEIIPYEQLWEELLTVIE